MADIIASADSNQLAEYAKTVVDSSDNRIVFLNYARESNIINDSVRAFVELLHKNQIQSVLVVDSGTYDQHYTRTKEFNNLGCELLFVDYFLVMVYHYLFVKQNQHKNISWNPDADQFLFLTGKYHKPNRAWLLYKFQQANIIDCCVWSLFVDQVDNTMSSTIPTLNNTEFLKFCNMHNRHLDHSAKYQGNISWQGKTIACLHYPGFPYDPKLFGKTAFRVISETRFQESVSDNSSFITEKTWITIFNSQPFIMASTPHSLQYLQRLGFRTYENYLPISDYDHIKSTEQRLDAIVENTKYWITNIRDHQAHIHRDVNHNFRQAIDLALQNIEKIEQTANKYNVHASFTELTPISYWL